MVFVVFLGFFNAVTLVMVWELWKGLGISGEPWDALSTLSVEVKGRGSSIRNGSASMVKGLRVKSQGLRVQFKRYPTLLP